MHENTEKYILDFSNVNYYLEVHEIIKNGLDFPDYYGKNWDAFWDCLTDMACGPKVICIWITGFARLEQKFPKAAKMIVDTFKELKQWVSDKKISEVHVEIISDDMRYNID